MQTDNVDTIQMRNERPAIKTQGEKNGTEIYQFWQTVALTMN